MIHLVLLILLLSGPSCSSMRTLKKNPSAQEIFNHAQWLKSRSYYKKSLTYFNRLKSQYLYHRLSREADFAIAEIYFAQKEWAQATKAYGRFFERYPKHPKGDLVLSRVGLSYFNQLPTTEDRDLSLAKRTIFYLNKHLKTYPRSPHRVETKKYKQKVLNLLARKEWITAQFHLKQERPRSALPYLLELKNTYLDTLTLKKGLPSPETLKKHLKKARSSLKKT